MFLFFGFIKDTWLISITIAIKRNDLLLEGSPFVRFKFNALLPEAGEFRSRSEGECDSA
ncbi:hypothetical protein [Vibrio gallaecicus]|uniref:hypothetical protein n=1 Tax=Vibrio gallaecicus TaxID=552386 RepID=UPI0025B36502|nr:hypothetical protein [Vibrio gallaecicus]MDN3615963.1 hypothetical protein [Vibrio gallaecicus]